MNFSFGGLAAIWVLLVILLLGERVLLKYFRYGPLCFRFVLNIGLVKR